MVDWEKLQDWRELQNWQNFTKPNLGNLPRKAGVYAIRYTSEGKPYPIARVFDKDTLGILCFGMSGKTQGLRTRLSKFYKAASGKKVAHAEGERYHHLQYAQRFPLNNLQFAYVETEAAEDQEKAWFNDYEKKFGELPPLNRRKG